MREPLKKLATGKLEPPVRLGKIRVNVLSTAFTKWHGKRMIDSYRKVPLYWKGRSVFAEVIVVRSLRAAGWNAVWIDSYGKCVRTGWRPELPRKRQKVLTAKQFGSKMPAQMYPAAFEKFGGAWDVVAWRRGSVRFYELKRKSSDKLRKSQEMWFRKLRMLGAKPEDFCVIDWRMIG